MITDWTRTLFKFALYRKRSGHKSFHPPRFPWSLLISHLKGPASWSRYIWQNVSPKPSPTTVRRFSKDSTAVLPLSSSSFLFWTVRPLMSLNWRKETAAIRGKDSIRTRESCHDATKAMISAATNPAVIWNTVPKRMPVAWG